MLRKKKYIVVGLVAMLALFTVAATWIHAPSPDPFGKYIVYSAAGVFDASIAPEVAVDEVKEFADYPDPLAAWFHYGVMGRDADALADEEAAANAYFESTFDSAYTSDSLWAFGLDPRVEYRAYYISGMKVPTEGWVVRDGGFMAMLDDGGIVVYGEYNIDVTRPGKGRQPDPIVIHYRSETPVYGMAPGFDHGPAEGLHFLCVVESDDFYDFEGGLAQGVMNSKIIGGYTVSNIRNIITFPGLGFDAPAGN